MKIFGIGIAIMLGLFMMGCEEGEDVTIEDTSDVTIEETVKEEEEQKDEEQKEEKQVLTFDNDEDFKYHMTTSLDESEYDEYFNKIKWTKDGKLKDIEFDGAIVLVTPREGYDTRMEVLLMVGDYSETEVTGPSIKVKDIGITDLNGLIEPGTNVKVKATLQGFDVDHGWLEISINDIESR